MKSCLEVAQFHAIQNKQVNTSAQNFHQDENTEKILSDTTSQVHPTKPAAHQKNLAPTVSTSPAPDDGQAEDDILQTDMEQSRMLFL